MICYGLKRISISGEFYVLGCNIQFQLHLHLALPVPGVYMFTSLLSSVMGTTENQLREKGAKSSGGCNALCAALHRTGVMLPPVKEKERSSYPPRSLVRITDRSTRLSDWLYHYLPMIVGQIPFPLGYVHAKCVYGCVRGLAYINQCGIHIYPIRVPVIFIQPHRQTKQTGSLTRCPAPARRVACMM